MQVGNELTYKLQACSQSCFIPATRWLYLGSHLLARLPVSSPVYRDSAHMFPFLGKEHMEDQSPLFVVFSLLMLSFSHNNKPYLLRALWNIFQQLCRHMEGEIRNTHICSSKNPLHMFYGKHLLPEFDWNELRKEHYR